MIMIGLFVILLGILSFLCGNYFFNSAVNCMDTPNLDSAGACYAISSMSIVSGPILIFIGLYKLGWLF